MCMWTKTFVVSSECEDLEATSTLVYEMLLLLLNCNMDQEEDQRPEDMHEEGWKTEKHYCEKGFFFLPCWLSPSISNSSFALWPAET